MASDRAKAFAKELAPYFGLWPTVNERIYDRLDAYATERAAEQIEACAKEIPSSWLDPLLSGPAAVLKSPPWACPEVQRLLTAIAERVRALRSAAAPTDSGASPGDGRQG